MKMLILATLMVAMQAPWPLPRETPREKTNNGNAIQKQSAKNEPTPGNKPSVTKPQETEPGADRNHPPAENDKDYHGQIFKVSVNKDCWDYLYIVGTILGSLCTLGIAFAAFWQSRRAIRLVERANVLLDGIDVLLRPLAFPGTDPFNGGSAIEARFRNFGRTAAINMKIDCSLYIGNTSHTSRAISDITLPPGNTHTIKFDTMFKMSGDKTEPILKQIREGVEFLVKGKISYMDAFRTRHIVEFCGRFDRGIRIFTIEKNQEYGKH